MWTIYTVESSEKKSKISVKLLDSYLTNLKI